MDDLFADTVAEFVEERAAIHEHDAGLDAKTALRMAAGATEGYRHACETRWVVGRYQKHGGEAVKAYLADVAKKRGQPAADRLRSDALAALKG